MPEKIKLALVDDHILLRNALTSIINSFDNCRVVYESGNGSEFISQVEKAGPPDLVLLDLNMPVMNGFETANWLRDNHPDIPVLMLTMYDSDLALVKLLQAGVKGFLRKDIEPVELKYAINSVMQSGYYYSTKTTGKLVNLFRSNNRDNFRFQDAMLSDQELLFLKYACTDLTYKEIAQKMQLTPRAVDSLRDQLFVKLDVKSRVGLAMLAIKNGVVGLLN